MNELEQVIQTRTISDATKQQYLRTYNKIVERLGSPINQASQEKSLKTVEAMSDNVGTQIQLLNIINMIRQHFKLENDKIVDIMNRKVERRKRLTKQNLMKKNEELPSYNTLKKHLSDLEKAGNHRAFIVNYLLLNYGLRNKDVNLFITDDKNKIEEGKNYLIRKKTEVEMIIQDYKTLTTYGVKKIIIKSPRFLRAVDAYGMNTYLLSLANDKTIPIQDTSLAKTVSNLTYNNLGEANYFKVLVKHIADSGKNVLEQLKKLSQYRGTDINTIIEYYNLNVK